jgi:hypothetical protein
MTSGAKSEGRFGKQDFRYVAEENVYICPTCSDLQTSGGGIAIIGQACAN